MADDLADAFRASDRLERPRKPDRPADQLDGSGLDEAAPQFADEKRVAFGEVVDCLRELAHLGTEFVACGAANEGRRPRRRKVRPV